MYNPPQFVKSHWNLIVYKDQKIIFKSKARGLKPLIIFIKKFDRKYKKLVVYDKIVGQAAALLLAYIKASNVYTPIISHGAASLFTKHKIGFMAQKRVKYIMDFASKELCQWEKLAKNKTPAQFWKLVKTL